MKKTVLAIFAIAFLAAGCSLQSGEKAIKSNDELQKQQPVSGLDANGCKVSEGYVYSQIRKECLKLSEKGIELPPNADNPEQRSAYVVLAIDDKTGGWKATSSDAEVFLPGVASSLVMTSKETINTGWTKVNGVATLTFWKGIYYFSNTADNNPLYQGSSKQTPIVGNDRDEMVGDDRDAHGCIGSAGYSWCESKQKCLRPWEEKCDEKTAPVAKISEKEARVIAEKFCVKSGDKIGAAAGVYNDNSKTWWFEAILGDTPKGCNPACVVSVETKTAEINWRCTGLKQ